MIKMMIMTKFHQFGKIRQLHTIISQETIKPFSPTPHNLKTHHLSILDHYLPNVNMPKVLFYKNYNRGDIELLKQSLSKCLTQYYPFAGRLSTPTKSYIDCNDEGIEFFEAYSDKKLDDFILNRNQDEMFDQLIPNIGSIFPKNLLEVQVNHFDGGGVAIAVSVTHKCADGFTSSSFINHWAAITRGEPSINPRFFSSFTKNDIIKVPDATINKSIDRAKYISRRYVFHNEKLKELKKNVLDMGTTPLNPTRVELLTSLLFKCVVRATTINSGYLKPSSLLHTVNMRNRVIKNCPETPAGNIMTVVAANMAGSIEIMMNEVIIELRKLKMEVEGVKDMKEVVNHFQNTVLKLGGSKNRSLVKTSSLCRFPFYNVDFGWGKPIKVMTSYPDENDNGFILLDTPFGNGIEALVHLKKEDMAIFEKDTELFKYGEHDE